MAIKMQPSRFEFPPAQLREQFQTRSFTFAGKVRGAVVVLQGFRISFNNGGFCQHSRQSRFMRNLIASILAKITEGGSFLLLSIVEIARYDRFGASADRTVAAGRCCRFCRHDGCFAENLMTQARGS